MGFGRFVCVAVPFGLTVASIICILIVMLAGVSNHNLDMFEVDTKNFSISTSALQNIANEAGLKRRDGSPADHFSSLTQAAQSSSTTLKEWSSSNSANLTAAELDLADTYKVSLWGYCAEYSNKTTTCTKAKFDWATAATNTTTLIHTAENSTGLTNVTIPKEMTTALHTFSVATKWTEVVYIIAILLGGAELTLGLFGFCSRIGSCLTFLISGLATTTLIVASILATVESSVVVGALKSTARAYSVQASLNTSFLATTWLGVAFSIAAGLFWSFSMCCCAADHHRNKRHSNGDREKLIPGAYQPISDPNHYNNGPQQTGVFNTGGVPGHNNKPQRLNGAYEPYSHAAI